MSRRKGPKPLYPQVKNLYPEVDSLIDRLVEPMTLERAIKTIEVASGVRVSKTTLKMWIAERRGERAA